jgi:hypothetical protein
MKNQCNFISNYANYEFLTTTKSHFSGCSLFHPSRHIILDLCKAPAREIYRYTLQSISISGMSKHLRM